jgi:hypothetical protein
VRVRGDFIGAGLVLHVTKKYDAGIILWTGQ